MDVETVDLETESDFALESDSEKRGKSKRQPEGQGPVRRGRKAKKETTSLSSGQLWNDWKLWDFEI